MGKFIISEQKLNALINECIEEVMIEEGIGQNVWNGIKKGAQAVGNGVKKFVKDPVGTAAGVKGWYDQTKNRMQNRWKEAYNIARDKVRLQSADDSVWDKLDDPEKQALLQVRGTDKFGNWKFNAIRYAKAVEKNGKDANEIAQIMTQRGFKGITPEYVQQMLAVGRNQTQTDDNNGEQTPNPDVRNSVQQNNGGNYGMDSAIEEAVQKAINEVVSEIGNTWKGQEMLGRLSARREKQSGDERRKASMALDPGEEEEHRKKAADYMGRATAAFVKARDERDNKYNSWTKPAQMMANAYHGGEEKGRRERK